MGKRNKAKNSKASTFKNLSKKSGAAFTSKKTSGINKISKASTNPNRVIEKGSEGFYRTKATINRLNMYRSKPGKDRYQRPEKSIKIDNFS